MTVAFKATTRRETFNTNNRAEDFKIITKTVTFTITFRMVTLNMATRTEYFESNI